MYKSYKLEFSIKHQDDWTVFTDNYNIDIKTINYFLLPQSNKIMDIEFFYFYLDESLHESLVDAKHFISSIKNSNNVKKMYATFINIKPYMKYYYITTVEDYSQSIRKIINEHMGVFLRTESRNGIEYYIVYFLYISTEEINAIREQLQNIGNIKLFDVQNSTSIQGLINPLFTASERRVLETAYKGGFFNYPRDIDLNELSKRVGLSKSALNFHLKNAMRKTLNYVFCSNEGSYNLDFYDKP